MGDPGKAAAGLPMDVVMISARGPVELILDILLKTCSQQGCELVALDPRRVEPTPGQPFQIDGYSLLAPAVGSRERPSPGEAAGKIELADLGQARTLVGVYPTGRDGTPLAPHRAERLLNLVMAFVGDLEDEGQAQRHPVSSRIPRGHRGARPSPASGSREETPKPPAIRP